MRKVKIRYPVIHYETKEVELLPYLKRIGVEAYYSRETKCVEIRVPTKWDGATNYIAEIPLDAIKETKEEIWEIVGSAKLGEFLEKYENDIKWEGKL